MIKKFEKNVSLQIFMKCFLSNEMCDYGKAQREFVKKPLTIPVFKYTKAVNSKNGRLLLAVVDV